MRVLNCAFAAAVLGLSAPVQADPLAPSTLPQDAQWVLHADVDAGRDATALWNIVRQRIFEPRLNDVAPRLNVLERVTGMRPAQDLKDITIYGTAYDEDSVCIRVHGTFDREKLISFLKSDIDYREMPYGKRTIVSGRDKVRDRPVHAAFAEGNIAFVSANVRAIEAALDLLDKKKPSLSANSALIPTISDAQPGKPMLWIAGNDLTELPRRKKTESPVIAQMDVASLGIRWVNERVTVDMHVRAKSETAAEQLEAVAKGA